MGFTVSRNLIVAVLLAVAAGAPPSAAEEARVPAAEAGQRIGLAKAAAQYCPAGVVTDKLKAFEAEYTGADGEVVKAEAEKVLEAWKQGTVCDENELDRHALSMCRTMRLRNCRAVWNQMGPQGGVMPGLVDADYSKVEE